MSLQQPENVLKIQSRNEFRDWLLKNSNTKTECWVACKRGKPADKQRLYYIDAVEEALCFGWIDSTCKKIDDTTYQRFSPRNKNARWTELNKERVRRLEKLGLMTDFGRAVLPDMKVTNFKIDKDVEAELKKNRVYSKFRKFPSLYQRVKAYNIAFYKDKDKQAYERMLSRLVEETKAGNMYGAWNDYGRLLDY